MQAVIDGATVAKVTLGLRGLAESMSAYVLALSLVGGLTMAVIQSIKDLSPFRRLFQMFWLRGWIKKGKIDRPIASHKIRDLLVEGEKGGVEKDLVRLATAGNAGAFYDLPIEQMCGQINAAMQIALESPKDHARLIIVFGSLAKEEDLLRVLGLSEDKGSSLKSSKGDARTEYNEARTRVAHLIQRAIDSIQIAEASDWQRWLKVLSLIVSVLILRQAAHYAGLDGERGIFMMVVLGGMVSGFLAPVVRDLLTALQSLKR